MRYTDVQNSHAHWVTGVANDSAAALKSGAGWNKFEFAFTANAALVDTVGKTAVKYLINQELFY